MMWETLTRAYYQYAAGIAERSGPFPLAASKAASGITTGVKKEQ